MPLYMDIHCCEGAHADDVAKAHLKDMEVQGDYDVEYKKYWFNEAAGKLFCLVEAPTAEAAQRVHIEAHGLAAEKFIEIDPDLVDSFMGASPANEAGAVIRGDKSEYDFGIRTIMFTDIVGSTEMCSRHGDDAAIAMLGVHDSIVRATLGEHRGREVKHTGDGIMAAFNSAASAVRSACKVIEGLRAHNDNGPDFEVMVRIGISAGEPVEQAADLFGSTVQLAARLCAQAQPGQVLVSNVVADLCIGKNLKFTHAGEVELKGFEGKIPTRAVLLEC